MIFPMPDAVIDKVEKLAKRKHRNGGWRVRDRNNEEFRLDDATGDKKDTTINAFLEKEKAHLDIPV